MRCTITGCPGEYEPRQVDQTFRRQGRLVVVEHVPAEVCAICGDVLLTPDTMRRLENILATSSRPHGTAPVYAFA